MRVLPLARDGQGDAVMQSGGGGRDKLQGNRGVWVA